jgi:hypothetical protein
MPCSAWICASKPPARFSRVIAKNEHDEIADCFYITAPNPGFYVTVPGGALPWPHATHYIPWPNAQGIATAACAPKNDQTASSPSP